MDFLNLAFKDILFLRTCYVLHHGFVKKTRDVCYLRHIISLISPVCRGTVSYYRTEHVKRYE